MTKHSYVSKQNRHFSIIPLSAQYYYYYYYNHYIRLTAFFQDYLGKPAPER